ncbi:MAG: lytic transglycosylase domain-containing protein [Defluviitaleaceae bacterium]|nr:lytic transglycosylase domain-containing protein [Defluviitaleaceae bacterium]
MSNFNSAAIVDMARARIDHAINQRLAGTQQGRGVDRASDAHPQAAGSVEELEGADFYQILNSYSHAVSNTPSGNINPIIDAAITAASTHHGVDANLIRAVIRAESSYNPLAVSHAGAMGLMQLMPATARNLGVTDPFDIMQNVNAGTTYLRSLLERFGGDEELALAGYNAGWPRVQQHGGIPPFAETMAYVPRVLGFREEYALAQYQQHADIRRR